MTDVWYEATAWAATPEDWTILSAEAEKLAVDPVHYKVSVVAAEKKVTFEFGVRTVGGVESLISFAEKPA